jgi:hypothetical protein
MKEGWRDTCGKTSFKCQVMQAHVSRDELVPVSAGNDERESCCSFRIIGYRR